MDFFYTPSALVVADSLTIEGAEFNHLTHVLRKGPGDHIMVTDGAGTAYEAVIVEVMHDKAVCGVLATHRMLHESRRSVHLGVALLKNSSKFDFLVEKCTELGVRSITPLVTERTIPRSARSDRWAKLALAAMKQSGRCILPLVSPPEALERFLAVRAADAVPLILHEKPGNPPLAALLPPAGTPAAVIFCIGPEGGFSDQEVARAVASGFRPAGLGTRRLRTETAAIAAAAVSLSVDPS